MDTPKGQGREDLIYKTSGGRELMLTYLPPLKTKYEKAPVYFMIPGGGWHTEDRESMFEFSAQSIEILRNSGFAAVAVDYRVCGDGAVMKDIITDCFDAVRYIAHFAETLKIDKNNIVTSGHSAGGHLALMLAYTLKEDFYDGYEFDEDFNIIGTAAFSPVTDISDTTKHNLRDVEDVFKDGFNKENTDKMSPINYVTEKATPTYLAAGICDYIVFPTSSESLYKKLCKVGVKSEIVYSYGGHCYEEILDAARGGASAFEIQEKAAKFIKEIVK